MDVVHSIWVDHACRIDCKEDVHSHYTARIALLVAAERLGQNTAVSLLDIAQRDAGIHILIPYLVHSFVPIDIDVQGLNLNGVLMSNKHLQVALSGSFQRVIHRQNVDRTRECVRKWVRHVQKWYGQQNEKQKSFQRNRR